MGRKMAFSSEKGVWMPPISAKNAKMSRESAPKTAKDGLKRRSFFGVIAAVIAGLSGLFTHTPSARKLISKPEVDPRMVIRVIGSDGKLDGLYRVDSVTAGSTVMVSCESEVTFFDEDAIREVIRRNRRST